jgi:hypothetical protein
MPVISVITLTPRGSSSRRRVEPRRLREALDVL